MRALVAAGVLLLALATAGAAAAEVVAGSPRPETLRGTVGADGIVAQDGGRDVVRCGRGPDVVTADLTDRVARDCETVSRQLARDRLRGGPGQHGSEVEPDTFAFGATVVATYQVARIRSGAAMAIGWSSSPDAGRTWRSGLLPGVTMFTTPPGIAGSASDPAVAYDAKHAVWLIATLGVGPGLSQLLVSRSHDARAWDLPVTAAATRANELAYDKEWIVCDNGGASPFRGRCYLSYTDLAHKRLATQWSDDGGVTWSPPVGAALELEDHVVGVQPATLPNGTLVIVFINENKNPNVWAVRSLDGGMTYATKTMVSQLDADGGRGLRAPPLPSVEADGAGRIWATWHDCRFREACSEGNDIVLTSTIDGAVWAPVLQVPVGSQVRSYVLPGLGASPTRLAVTYYSLPFRCFARCQLSVRYVERQANRNAWTPPRRLTPQPIPEAWIAETTQGRMVGDYISTSWAARRFVAVWIGASMPRAGRLRETAFAFAP